MWLSSLLSSLLLLLYTSGVFVYLSYTWFSRLHLVPINRIITPSKAAKVSDIVNTV